MLAVFRQEFRLQRGSWIAWTIALIGLAAVYISVYPAFAKDAQAVTEAFSKLPQAIKNAMGTGGFQLLNFPGFIANVLPVFMLGGGIQAIGMGIAMLNRERLAGTSDFLLTKPLTRSNVFWQKLLANGGMLALTSFILITTLYTGAHVVKAESFSITTFLMVMAAFTLVQFWFLAVGALISQVAGRIRNSVGLSIALCFGLFILAMFSSIVGDEAIRYITPYKYIDLLKVVQDGAYEPMHLVVWLVVVTGSIVISWQLFRQRDVETAS